MNFVGENMTCFKRAIIGYVMSMLVLLVISGTQYKDNKSISVESMDIMLIEDNKYLADQGFVKVKYNPKSADGSFTYIVWVANEMEDEASKLFVINQFKDWSYVPLNQGTQHFVILKQRTEDFNQQLRYVMPSSNKTGISLLDYIFDADTYFVERSIPLVYEGEQRCEAYTRSNVFVDWVKMGSLIESADEYDRYADQIDAEYVAEVFEHIKGKAYNENKIHENTERLYDYWDGNLYVNGYAGVCRDNAKLFAAYLRCKGIPCKYVVGTIIQDGTPVYHAWNEFYMKDAWHPVDTTLGTGYITADYVKAYEI